MPQVVRVITTLDSLIILLSRKKKGPHVDCDHTVVVMMRRLRAEICSQSEGWPGHRGRSEGHEEDMSSIPNK